MKFKKGFTLSEVLITLTLIGIITTLTIPSLVASTDKSKKATALKKAYNTISGAYTQALTEKPGIANLKTLTEEMVKHLNVKYYIKETTTKKTKVSTHNAKAGSGKTTYWIVTEDGIGYKIKQVNASGACTKSKVDFAASNTYTETNCCYLVTIDIDGPQKGDNSDANVTLSDDGKDIASISGDRFVVYATQQGLTVGNKDWESTNAINAAARIIEAND